MQGEKLMKKMILIMTAACLLAMSAFAASPAKSEAGMGATQRTPNLEKTGPRITADYAREKAARHGGSARLDAVVTSLCNALVCVQLSDAGDFNIGTPDGRSLLYYYPSEPGTSNIVVSIDGQTYPLELNGPGCNGTSTFDSWTNDGTSITANFTINGYIHAQVIHTPTMFNATSGAILTRTVVSNDDPTGAAHTIGVLYEYDTTVDGDDAAQLYLGPNYVNVETCYDAPYAANYWDAIPFSGTLVGRGTITGGQAVTPDHLAFGQWGAFVGVCWNYACSGNPYGDSAVLYKWDESPVPSGGTRNVATYYGVGEIQVAPGDLQLSASIPPLACTPTAGVQPNPFQVLVNVTNTGGSSCNEISVNLSNGAGPGGTGSVTSTNPQYIPALNSGDNSAVSFTVALTANPAGGCVNFTAVISSPNCPANTLNFCVEVPACSPLDCRFPYDASDLGDLFRCNYPTLRTGPAHGLSGVAWLGERITAEANPRIFNADQADDGVNFIGLPWTPCTAEQVQVTVTGGPNYSRYVDCGGHLYLNAWKDGNLDNDFCDELCDGRVSEWIIQDVPVTPGTAMYTVWDPGVNNIGVYAGVFRFRLTSVPVGRFGYGNTDMTICPDCACPGTFGQDSVGEVEDYYIPDAQLAVNLADYSAVSQNGHVELVWSTSSETDNDRFEVMRNDVQVASITSQGNTANGHTYRYSDASVEVGSQYEYTLVSVDLTGARKTLGSRTVTVNNSGSNAVVTEYALHQNFPNPFNPTTQIAFDLVESGHVTLTVYNPMGQEVAKLVNGNLGAGTHSVSFNAASLPSGIYFYRLNVNGFSADMKMLLMK
jgi:hypothetical protein